MGAAILDRARAWLAQDPDEQTRTELAALIERVEAGDEDAADDLADRFDGRLQFGTAGLRGALGAGSNRMNRVLVAQAAAGFAEFLRTRDPEATPTVVVGYDGRRNSDVFARDSAELFAGAGLRAILLPRRLPTPVLAFAVRHFGADAGVMVTASHNPPNDNGYKVYLGGSDAGSQIVAPSDADIAASIRRVADEQSVSDLPRSTAYEIADEAVIEAYVSATAAVGPAPEGAAGTRWVYTAMHGVGWETFSRVLEEAGYPQPTVVPEQIEPDGTFPTVAFPNPEEPGAMDLAFATAAASGAEFVLAQDPDADRLAVAIPAESGWRRLTGNEVGLLLGRRAARAAAGTPDASLACSLVSSPGLGAIAEKYGLGFHETLTGFKWISRAPGLVFGFEEALGYLVNPETVRDKDGISASIAFLELAAEARGRGATIADLLDELTAEIGFYASGQVSLRVEDVSTIATIMASLRAEPPAAFGETAVERADDLLQDPARLGGDVLRYALADGSRVIARPSGTEPKLKAYLDVRGESAEDSAARLVALEQAVRELLDRLS
ncbi:phospho-sugar mutase [Microbacterium paludicola]|uniref:Phospho-sugar mutase n=1 Tax=Microbacterium paludicola TaxID=300019 RepID=A0A4Y9FQ28_9MICO|nr:phospho-sugar mutase [Microbacterium paludicola]MBF0817643.1 phospho-sugar mutase [Microbacterium paludicola]TFU30409.1 phospho-sugar mutase [Microbacterium paludicola]